MSFIKGAEKQVSMQDRFNHLIKVISSQRFLLKQGLGNEIPFFICDYLPEEAVEMAKLQKQLMRKLSQLNVHVLHVDLYDLAIELLQRRGIWKDVLETETTVSKDELVELLQGVLDPETHLAPAIAEKMKESPFDVLILTGVGEVFPYIRSHNVLNNLQRIAKDKPTLLFFPGGYTLAAETGASLDLFGRLHDDKYYRAFNIQHFEV